MKGFTVYVPPKPAPVIVGAVYILMLSDRCIYVGQTKNLDRRMSAHHARRLHHNKRWRYRFDNAFWISVSVGDLDAYEGAITRALNPEKTRRTPPDSSRDQEILALLGMQSDETRAFERRVDAAQKQQGRRLKGIVRTRNRRRKDSSARVLALIEAVA